MSTVVRADQTLLPTLSKSGGTLFLKSIAKKTSTTIQLEKDDTKLLIVSPSKANVNKAMHYLRGEKYESVAEYVDITKNAGLVIGANGRKLNELRTCNGLHFVSSLSQLSPSLPVSIAQ